MTIRHRVTKFTSLRVALKEIGQFVRDPTHLLTGKPLSKFGGARPRELLANWLVCACMNNGDLGDRYVFTSDPTGGDGIIFDTVRKATWPTEHVMVPPPREASEASIEDRILAGVRAKISKGGAAYANGKTLVAFLEGGGGSWLPNAVTRALPTPLHFDTVWAVALQCVEDNHYIYGVANLQLAEGNAPAFRVTISPNFDTWDVDRIQ